MFPGGVPVPEDELPAAPEPGMDAGPMFPSIDPASFAGPVQQLIAMIRSAQDQDRAQFAAAQQQAVEPALQALLAAVRGESLAASGVESVMPVDDVEDPADGGVV